MYHAKIYIYILIIISLCVFSVQFNAQAGTISPDLQLVLEGAGPIESVKRSVATLKNTWGTALMGNFSLGLMGFLVMIPVFAICLLLLWLAQSAGSLAISGPLIAAALVIAVVGMAAMAAADTIFKALLYSYATDQTLPASLDKSIYDNAFVSKA